MGRSSSSKSTRQVRIRNLTDNPWIFEAKVGSQRHFLEFGPNGCGRRGDDGYEKGADIQMLSEDRYELFEDKLAGLKSDAGEGGAFEIYTVS